MLQAFDRCKKKIIDKILIKRPQRIMESGRLRTQFQRFGANFVDRWPRWTGARLIEVHLHAKSFGGGL